MEPRIITRDSFNVIGYELRTSVIDGVNLKEIPEFWDHYRKQGLAATIQGKKDEGIELGICCDFDSVKKQISYIIGFETDCSEVVSEKMTLKRVPASRYAVFTTQKVKAEQFSSSIQELTRYIHHQWLPKSGYQYNSDAFDIEIYDRKSCPDLYEYVRMEICIPIK